MKAADAAPEMTVEQYAMAVAVMGRAQYRAKLRELRRAGASPAFLDQVRMYRALCVRGIEPLEPLRVKLARIKAAA